MTGRVRALPGVLHSVLLVLVATVFGCVGTEALARDASGPFRVRVGDPEAKIRAAILEQTPPGTSKQAVLEFIDERLRHEGRVRVQPHGARVRCAGRNCADRYVGVSCIDTLEVGRYGGWRHLFLNWNYVYLSWAFDGGDRLIDVIVHKEWDGV